jgi:hypothetical protein
MDSWLGGKCHPSNAGGSHTAAGRSLGIPYALENTAVGFGVSPNVNLEELARELGAMEPWETLERE